MKHSVYLTNDEAMMIYSALNIVAADNDRLENNERASMQRALRDNIREQWLNDPTINICCVESQKCA